MNALIRFRDWWLGQFKRTSRLGKMVWVGAPLLFACCFCWTALLVVVPSPDVEPTAELAERAGATVAVVDVVATEEPVEATAAPTEVEPTQTAAPTAVPTETEEPATATARPSVTPRPATATPAPSATPRPATATRVPPTVAPPTAVPPTPVPQTVAPPTAPPQPTATMPPAVTSGDVVISSVRYDGDVPQVESDEYAVILNRGSVAVNLGGWRLNAGEPDQNFTFPSFDLQPQQSCRVYTNEFHPESCGFTFGRGDAIWRNSGDCGTLHDATGAEVSRFCWN